MTRPRSVQRRRYAWLMLLGLLCVARPLPSAAKPKPSDALRAQRLINELRLDEARLVLRVLELDQPSSDEVRWLRAELAFYDGNYGQAAAEARAIAAPEMQARVEELHQLALDAARATAGMQQTRSAQGHFVIYHAAADLAIAPLAAATLERAYAVLGDDLELRPTTPLRVELAPDLEALARLARLSTADLTRTGTVAIAKYNKLVALSPRATVYGYPWQDTLAHEYTHHVVTLLTHDRAPVWFQEGLARFEQSRWRAAPGLTLNPSEAQLLVDATKQKTFITLEQMSPSLAKLPSQELAQLAYLETYFLLAMLHADLGYPGLRAVLAKQRREPNMRRILADQYGRSWNALEQRWRGRLRTTAMNARGKHAVRFHRGDAPIEDNSALPKPARKHARLAGLLRTQGFGEAAALEYEKALQHATGNAALTSRLAGLLVGLGQVDRALELAKPLADVDELDVVSARTTAQALARKADPAGAARYFEQALRISPFDAQIRCGLALAYAAINNAQHTVEQAACDLLQRAANVGTTAP